MSEEDMKVVREALITASKAKKPRAMWDLIVNVMNLLADICVEGGIKKDVEVESS